MKKTYILPSMKMVQIKMPAMICGSQDIISDKGITYGGVDEEGEKDPDARQMNDRYGAWEDEEEEEW